jgi:hypothetical protein
MSQAYWNDSDMGLTKREYKIVHLPVLNVGRYVTIARSTTACTAKASSQEAAMTAIEETSVR